MKKWMFAVAVLSFLSLPALADEVDDEIANLKNSEEDVREDAAERLGQLGDPRAVAPLIQALRDDEDEVVEKAAEALGNLGDLEAVDPLLDTFNTHSLDWGIRVKSARALELLGDPKALPALQEALRGEQNPFVATHIQRAVKTLEAHQGGNNSGEPVSPAAE